MVTNCKQDYVIVLGEFKKYSKNPWSCGTHTFPMEVYQQGLCFTGFDDALSGEMCDFRMDMAFRFYYITCKKQQGHYA